MSKRLTEFFNEPVSLETEIAVSNDMFVLSLLSDIGLREEKMWSPDEEELYQKLITASKKHTANQLKLIRQHNEQLNKPKL